MVVPCPRLDDLVHRAAALAGDLTASERHTRIILTSHPDGSVTQSSSKDAVEAIVARFRKDGFPPTADALCLAYVGIEPVDNEKTAGVFLFAAERGAAQAYILAQPFTATRFMRFFSRVNKGELRVLKTVPAPVPAPDPEQLLEGSPEPMAMFAALRDKEYVMWAFEQLRQRGRDALSIAPLLQHSRCSLDRMAARLLADAIAIDSVPGSPCVGLTQQDFKDVFAEHPDGHKTSSWLLLDYWSRLQDSGWLHAWSAGDIESLRVKLVTAFRDDPANLHYVLTGAQLDEEIMSEDWDDAVRRFTEASRGRFTPEGVIRKAARADDDDSERGTLSFTFGGRRRKIDIERNSATDFLHDGFNAALAAGGVEERFFILPASDDTRRIVFVKPDLHDRAVAAGVIPGPETQADARLPRRLRRTRRIRVFKGDTMLEPPVVRDRIVIVETDLDIVRLDAPEFNVAWRAPAGMPLRMVNESVLVRQRYPDLRIRSLALDSGEQLWEHPIPNNVHVRTWRDQIVVFGNPVQFLRQDTGELLRELPLPAHSRLNPHHDFVLLQADEALSAIDIVTGERLWPGTWPREVVDALAYDGETVLHQEQNGNDCVLSVRASTRVSKVCFRRDATAPAIVWTTEFRTSQRWPTVDGDRLFALSQGHFRCLDLITGQQVYDHEFPALDSPTDVTSEPGVVRGEMISFVTFKGLRGFRAGDGELMAQYDGTIDGPPLWFGDRYAVLGAGGWLSEFR